MCFVVVPSTVTLALPVRNSSDSFRAKPLATMVPPIPLPRIATGSKLAPEMVPGLAEGAHQFYELEGARKLRDALDAFTGGKIVVNI